jgi:cell division protease FtsH
VTFDDVAGIDEAKEELEEIVEFLRNPQKFSRLAAKSPKAPCWSARPAPVKPCWPAPLRVRRACRSSPSRALTFVEMFVGVGASRVRDMFEQAKKTPPASCSSTRLTPWAGRAASASAAAMTNVSRR